MAVYQVVIKTLLCSEWPKFEKKRAQKSTKMFQVFIKELTIFNLTSEHAPISTHQVYTI